jgi:tetratricopeptide (TPR) repeat protein
MGKFSRFLLVVTSGIIIMILVKVILDFPYISKIPELPELETLSNPLRSQLKNAAFRAKINSTADNMGKLGMVYHSCSNYEKAAICYQLAIKKNKSKWIWSYYLGYLNREMGESRNSIANFQTVIKENPKAFLAWYYLGEAHQNVGENDKAIVAFEKITPWLIKEQEAGTTTRVDFFSLNTYAKCQLASLYINTNRFDLAEESLNEIIDGNKSFGWAYRLLGRIYSLNGDSVLSNKFVIRANDLISYTIPVDTLTDKLALLSRSELYLLKQIDEADKTRYFDWESKLVNQGLKYLPDNKYLISKAITFYLKTDSAKSALPLLRKHFEAFSNDFNELKYVANLLFEKRYFAQSNIYYNRSLELKPEDTDIQVYLVLGLYNQNEQLKAFNLMEDYFKKDSLNTNIVANSVIELLDMEEVEKAEFYLDKLKQLSPSDPKTLMLSGKIAQMNGDLKTAQAFYELSFEKNPGDVVCMKALSDVLMRQKLWEKAIVHFNKSMIYFPNEPYLLEIFGTLLVVCPDSNLRNYNEGIEYLERAFYHKDCPPETAISAGKSLADAYIAIGNKQVAAAYLKTVIDFAKKLNLSQEYVGKLETKLRELNS